MTYCEPQSVVIPDLLAHLYLSNHMIPLFGESSHHCILKTCFQAPPVRVRPGLHREQDSSCDFHACAIGQTYMYVYMYIRGTHTRACFTH